MDKKPKTIIAYKGFDRNWQCRGFQYELGQSYEHKGVIQMCGAGFHACEHPLNVFNHYPPAISKYAVVELSGDTTRGNRLDTTVAAAKIAIKDELQISELVEAAINHVFDSAKWLKKSTATKHNQAASATGNYGAASATGYEGVASATGYEGTASATGNQGTASATGLEGAAAATGDWGAASATGARGAAAATGKYGAASATGDQGAASATGLEGAASATGARGAASATGKYGAASATGDRGAATASGYKGRAKGANGNALFLCERNNQYEIIAVWAGVVGKNGIKPDIFYTLENGEPTEITINHQ